MLRSRALGLFTSLALVGAPAAVISMPGSAAAAETTEMSASVTPKKGMYNDDAAGAAAAPDVVKYKGRLRTAAGDDIAGVTVVLERKLATEPAYSVLDSMTTGGKGRAKFATPVAGNAKYRVVFAGNDTYSASSSTAMKLNAMRDFNARMVEKGSGADKKAFLKGNINPGWDHRGVSWQRKKCGTCGWKTLDKKKSGGAGGWRFRAGFPKVGKVWRFRARIGGTDSFVAGTSAVLRTRTVRARGAGNLASLG